ncbi:Rhodanese-like domain-containing protein [Irpex rosettiformis]|uniref:Rhodanese-like domain-containing protein n=1 Tax=Irpex rosettiformis TaxID=378272 RepID=A0ACB8TYF4_9APHY|nr:Rhodanese-like domain-containing protein [Irpex rosettiformis]
MRVKYITPDDLAAIMKSSKVPNKDYCIIDVRDDDWHGGNIKNSQNSPSHGFLLKVDKLVQETKNIPVVVFHCALSQIYAETRDLLQAEGEDIPHEVLVLQGGFSDFQAKFHKDPELVENWDAKVWASEWVI